MYTANMGIMARRKVGVTTVMAIIEANMAIDDDKSCRREGEDKKIVKRRGG
jgi:hypothetical protein